MDHLDTVCYSLASFLDRPLAWRSGLPPSAGGLGLSGLPGLNDLQAKNLDLSLAFAADERGRAPVYTTAVRAVVVRDAADAPDRLRFGMRDFVRATVWANHDMLRLRSAQDGSVAVSLSALADPQEHAEQPQQPQQLRLLPDGRADMVLSHADAAAAVECGWAEQTAHSRPPGLGGLSALPGFSTLSSHVTVHPPRCAAELADWKLLALASMRFCAETVPTVSQLRVRRPERL